MPLREVNGVRLLVEESGEGDPLVLVHGSWDDRHAWALVEPELARSFRVVGYDRRGHTDSEDGPAPGSRRDDEDDLAVLIEDAGGGSANVVANSFGSSIALGLAARRPELFRTLCAHEPPLMSLAADDPMVAEVDRAIEPVLELIERGEIETAARDFVENIAIGPGGWEMLSDADRASAVANARTFAEEQRDAAWADADLEGLAGVGFPVLLTKGDDSPPFFAKIIERLVEAMKGAQVTTVPGAGHVPHATHPDDYVAVIRSFAEGRGP